MARNLAMQVAALNPKYTDRSEVSDEYLAHEEEILRAQIANDPKESQKPEKVIEGMIKGRINKELKEVVLLDQVYVKAEDGKQIVSKYVEEVAKANNANIKIKGFVRFETGEGIEKKEEDFAAEVAAQAAKDAADGTKIPETFKDYLQKYVYGCKDQDDLLNVLGGARLMNLKNEPHLGYSTRH